MRPLPPALASPAARARGLVRNWPTVTAVCASFLLLVALVAKDRVERSAALVRDGACARAVTAYVAEIERLVVDPGGHAAARRARLEERLRRACLVPSA